MEIKGQLASDNICKLLHIIGDGKKTSQPNGLLFLYAEKAFDRLEWGYFWGKSWKKLNLVQI